MPEIGPFPSMFSPPDPNRPAALFGMIPEEILRGERLWTLGTHVFVHANVGHLLGNVGGLLLLGPTIDYRLGHVRATAIICATATIGAVMHALVGPDPSTTIVGASAVVYGFAGAHLVLFPRRPMLLGSGAGLVLKVPTWGWLLAVIAVTTAIQVWTEAPIAWLGHLGGFLAGAALALLFRSAPTPPAFDRLEARRERRLRAAA